jgi:hypothetical protein
MPSAADGGAASIVGVSASAGERILGLLQQLAVGQQQLAVGLQQLPAAILAALAPEIRSQSYDMSAMSGIRLRDALLSNSIVLRKLPTTPGGHDAAPSPFLPYDWRPGGRIIDLKEEDATNGNPPEFSGPSLRHHAASSVAPLTMALSAPAAVQQAPPRQRAASESQSVRALLPRSVRSSTQSSTMGGAGSTGVSASTAADVRVSYPSLLSHLMAAAPDDIRGVIFADARKATLEFPYTVPSKSTHAVVHVAVSGHPDAAVFHPDSASPRARVAHDLSLALLLFDWKTPSAMQLSNAVAVESQVCSEAVAFRAMYGYCVPVVATDLCTAIRVWRFDGSVLSEIRGADHAELSLDQGIQVVWKLVREQLVTVTAWLALKSTQSPRPHGGEDRGDDADGGDGGAGSGKDGGGEDDIDLGAAPPRMNAGAAGGAGRSVVLRSAMGSAKGPIDESCAPVANVPSRSELELYDDLEREVVAQKVAMVWRNSPSLRGLAARVASEASYAAVGRTDNANGTGSSFY